MTPTRTVVQRAHWVKGRPLRLPRTRSGRSMGRSGPHGPDVARAPLVTALHRLTAIANSAQDEDELLSTAGQVLAEAAGAAQCRVGVSPADRRPGAGGSPDDDLPPPGVLRVPVTFAGDRLAVIDLLGDVGPEEAGLTADLAMIGAQLGIAVDRLRRARDLARLNRELERSNEDLDRFASVASHDLREPVRRVVAFADLLLDRFGADLPPEAITYVEAILRGGRRMDRLTQDLLAYARVALDEVRVVVPVRDVVDGALDELAGAIADVLAAGGTVEVHDPLPVVRGDPIALGQLVRNLLANALRHGGEPPRVEIRGAGAGDRWWIEVVDHGPGIPLEHRERVLQPFVRGPDARGEGTGVGLAICRRVAEHHGADVSISATPGGGTTVRIQTGGTP